MASVKLPEIIPADVLFIRRRLLGDIIFTIPAIQIFKRHRPQSRVHYVVEDRFRDIAEIIPGIDHIIGANQYDNAQQGYIDQGAGNFVVDVPVQPVFVNWTKTLFHGLYLANCRSFFIFFDSN